MRLQGLKRGSSHGRGLKGFKITISTSSNEHLECKQSQSERRTNEEVRHVTIPRIEKFKYLGSSLHIDKDIVHPIRMGSQNWRNVSEVL